MTNYESGFLYQMLVDPIAKQLKYKVKDESFGRRDLAYNPVEVELRDKRIMHSEIYLDTDLGKVYYQTLWNKELFPNEDDIKCDVIKIHGYADYGGRFSNLAKYYLDAGIRFHLVDLPGHGRSDGLHAYNPNLEAISKILDQIKSTVTKDFQPKKLFIMGGSLGGLLSLHTVSSNKGYNGIIAICPCLKVHDKMKPPQPVIAIGQFFNYFLPKLPVLAYNLDPASKSYEAELMFFKDPMTYTGPLRLATGMMLDSSISIVLPELSKIQIPILVQQGDSDKMVDPLGAQIIMDNVSSKDKQLIMYVDGEHDLHNDFTGEAVIADSIKWILDRC